MMLTRIMCVGPGRINEALATLSFDFQFAQCPVHHTYIITPYDSGVFLKLFDQFQITGEFTFLDDSYFSNYYDLSRWSHDNWYKQQALKLCALDHLPEDCFLIQDCDLILMQPYSAMVNGNLNFKAEQMWNSYHTLYALMVEKIIGMNRVEQCSLVNELLPYTKKDWLSLRDLIERRHNTNFLDAIADIHPFDDTKWFSEYELLGIYKTNQQTGWQHFITTSQPAIQRWEEFYSTDWKRQHSVKFHTSPLKFMDEDSSKRVVDFLKKILE